MSPNENSLSCPNRCSIFVSCEMWGVLCAAHFSGRHEENISKVQVLSSPDCHVSARMLLLGTASMPPRVDSTWSDMGTPIHRCLREDSIYLYIYICIYIHTYIHACIHTYICIYNDINKAMSSYFDGLYHPFMMFWGWFTIALGTLRRELWHNFADYYI